MGKFIVGILMILAGIALGLYVGLYLCFVGGIVSIIEGAKADPVSAAGIAWGIVKMFFAAGLGWFSFFALAVPGFFMVAAGVDRK